MSRNVLDVLPKDLAFLAPAVRAMLAIRAKFCPSVDPGKFSEAAAAEELDQCGRQYEQLLYEALKKQFPKDSGAAFNNRVIAFGDALWKWLNAYRGDRNTPEVALLFTIVGTIPRAKEKTWFQRAGSALGTAYGRFTRPSG
jgi:hypothetical protein